MFLDRLRQFLAAAAVTLHEPKATPEPAPVEVPRPSDEVALRHLHSRRDVIERRIGHIKGRIAAADADLVRNREELRRVKFDIESIERGLPKPW